MTVLSCIGCLLTAFGPPVALFFMVVLKSAPRVLLVLANAFFALISLFCTSLVWFAIATGVPAQSTTGVTNIGFSAGTLAFSVFFQEALRWVSWKTLSYSEGHIDMASTHPRSPITRAMHSVVSGIGFGLMIALTTYIPMLVEAAGPGVLIRPGCPGVSALFTGAISTVLLFFHHIGWSVLMFEGLWHRRPALVAWTVLSHYVVSYSSLMNAGLSSPVNCVYPILISMAVLGISAGLATSITSRAVRRIPSAPQ
ncbi:hypothetical protein RI367_007522 [Sorochytrium milnesiophthora]